MRTLNTIALVLTIVGGLNWGLVGLAEFDLVAAIFGPGSALARIRNNPSESDHTLDGVGADRARGHFIASGEW
jgi:hypothetical protein